MSYLGVTIDKSLLFKKHLSKAAAKAEKVGTQLARLMPNVGGPRENRRRLLSTVVHSVLLYGAPAWADTLDLVPANVKSINKVQRKVLLRRTCAYRTVSEAAINVIAATPPADLLASEREVEFLRRRLGAGAPPRFDLVNNWQERWEVSGCWTRELIPNVKRWYARSFGMTNFHLTQFLSGHGCFGSYLNRIRKLESPACIDCSAPCDDAEHAFFICDRWWRQRRELEAKLEEEFKPESAIEAMLKSSNNFSAINAFVDNVLKTRENEERERQRRPDNL